jgi:hypothetical protein
VEFAVPDLVEQNGRPESFQACLEQGRLDDTPGWGVVSAVTELRIMGKRSAPATPVSRIRRRLTSRGACTELTVVGKP